MNASVLTSMFCKCHEGAGASSLGEGGFLEKIFKQFLKTEKDVAEESHSVNCSNTKGKSYI